jgi:CO/xanthine dehydrogenase FAD-binding subunit
VALDATVKTSSRELKAEELFAAVPCGSTVLDPGELVEEVRVPGRAQNARQAFIKFRVRKSIDFPVLSVAVVVDLEGDKIGGARIVLGAAAPVPLRARSAEAYLAGRDLSEDTACEAARLAISECIPLAHNEYKVAILVALVKRALLSAA